MYLHELRLKWALAHLQRLQAEIRGYEGDGPYRIVKEFDPQKSEYIIKAEIVTPIPVEFGLMVGDCLHNLRAGLDSLAYELACSNFGGPLPESIAKTSEFPIFGDKAMSAGAREKRIGSIQPTAQRIIDEVQPYKRGKDFASDPLWLLHKLSNIDKHRLFLLALYDHERTEIQPIKGRLLGADISFGGPLEAEAITARCYVEPMEPGGEVDVHFDPSFKVSFEKSSPAGSERVLVVMSRIWRCIIEDVVTPLIPYIR